MCVCVCECLFVGARLPFAAPPVVVFGFVCVCECVAVGARLPFAALLVVVSCSGIEKMYAPGSVPSCKAERD